MSPERSGCYTEEEHVPTPKMSVPASPVAGTPIREAQSPISILLAVAQSDDDLTSLSWLQDKDILKGMNLINPSPSSSLQTTSLKQYNNNKNLSPTSDFVDDSSISATESSSCSSSMNSPTPPQQCSAVVNNHNNNNNNNSIRPSNKHPHNVRYDPLIHTSKKPPYSFSCLIFMAIEDSEQKALPVKEIYAWILDHFPYYKNAPTGWKNSVRHNLSLNKCFEKVEKAPNIGKGSLWTVDPQYRSNLLQAMTRSPYHPCSTLDPSSYFNGTTNNNNNSRIRSLQQERTPIGHNNNVESLYPNLSSGTTNKCATRFDDSSSINEDSLDAVDAATVMLSLRNGTRPTKQRKVWQVITTSPSQDHTYSAAESCLNGTIDKDNFMADNERSFHKSSASRRINFEDEEEDRRIKEGAETLLNLAGITTYKRPHNYHNNNNNNNLINNNNFSMSYETVKRFKSDEAANYDADQPVASKPSQFRPRLLRKKRDTKKCTKNAGGGKSEDEWVKHRRELEINGDR